MKHTILFVCIALVVCSCTSQVKITKPFGERTVINLADRSKHTVELLEMTEDVLYVRKENGIAVIPFGEIGQIRVKGYKINPWFKVLWALPPLFIETMIVIAAIEVEQPTWVLFGIASAVGTSLAFNIKDQKAEYVSPYSKENKEELRLFCRYPQGLSKEQRMELLKYYGQEEFYKMGEEKNDR